MTPTILVCGRCGKTQERDAALAAGWLEAQRVGSPAGYLVIRCTDHITGHALRLAGLPQQRMSKRILDNLDRGLWTEYGSGYIASAWLDLGAAALTAEDLADDDLGEYVIQYSKEDMPPFKAERFHAVEALIAAMRKIEPDLRKWKLTEKS